jgi:hypothetical protein
VQGLPSLDSPPEAGKFAGPVSEYALISADHPDWGGHRIDGRRGRRIRIICAAAGSGVGMEGASRPHVLRSDMADRSSGSGARPGERRRSNSPRAVLTRARLLRQTSHWFAAADRYLPQRISAAATPTDVRCLDLRQRLPSAVITGSTSSAATRLSTSGLFCGRGRAEHRRESRTWGRAGDRRSHEPAVNRRGSRTLGRVGSHKTVVDRRESRTEPDTARRVLN